MAQIITATFRDGAFVPEQAVTVAAGTRVRLTVESVDDAHSAQRSEKTPLQEVCEQYPIHSGLRMTRDELHERD